MKILANLNLSWLQQEKVILEEKIDNFRNPIILKSNKELKSKKAMFYRGKIN